ncbi:uncharacterized protein Tco025E_01735 [Trypanosoma conorhini]|uniref:Uncharacterized protein n=1 Tax=Trypanosoma conorhini TaxID=83891 RepID=A0A3R7PJ11_9TRYP|nr:uncharacterized protein Tco025E_01735 [Trypanosoma conorhini]RNF26030.1 hypothetical protein Tco025E_01735 [Trypanosoma conorhini]
MTPSSLSGRVSPGLSVTAGISPQTVLQAELVTTVDEESVSRLELVEAVNAVFMTLCVDAEAERRLDLERQEQLVSLAFKELSIRLSIYAEEALGIPTFDHPPFPFVSETSAEVVARFFTALGTTDVKGEAVIAASACRLLFFQAIGVEMLAGPRTELVSFEEFRQLLTRACQSEAEVVGRMRRFTSAAKRRERPTSLTPSQELRVGFWAYRCVKPCVVEDWRRVWVVLEDGARLVIRRPNARAAELTIAAGHVIKCRLSSMLATQAPRPCAKNGLYLQLSVGANPVLLLLCPQRVLHAHALVKMFRLGVKREPPAVARDAVAEMTEAPKDKNEDKITAAAAGAGGAICRPGSAPRATKVWCCRGGCSTFVRSVWVLAGDVVVHSTEGEQQQFTWSLATARDVYLVNQLAIKPPTGVAKNAFVIVHETGSLFCCTETAAARDALVAYIKRVLFKQFLQSNQTHTSALTPLRPGQTKEGGCGVPLAAAAHRVPGAAQSLPR